MPKTVEDILKEQGVIKPIPQEEVETEKFEKEGTDRRKIQMSIENATIITVILLFISYLFFIVIINLILR